MNDDDLIELLLDRWEEACDRGERLSPESLAPDRPDLVPQLSRKIESMLAMRVIEATELGGGRGRGSRDGDSPRLIRGHYKLERMLGSGSEGIVWLAHDTAMDRKVAIKISRHPDDPLLEEARLIAKLRHPHILKVLEAGQTDDGNAFVVTELMQRTLADRIRDRTRGPVPRTRAVAWIRQLADALHEVHLAGRAHRDVKSINILLDTNDDVVLADFGIAISVAIENTGASRGTTPYKSPEQLAGEQLDARSDVYSLGLVAHEILTGRLPYTDAKDAAATEREIRAGVDRLVSREVPARLRPVLRKALALSRTDRHESAPQFAREFERAWRSSIVRRWVGAMALAMLACAVLFGWRLRADFRRTQEAVRRQTDEAMKAAREGMRVHDEAQRKVQEVMQLGKKLIGEVKNDPFHRARQAENDARRDAGGGK